MRIFGGRIAVVAVAVLVALIAAPVASAKKPVASIADTQVNEPAAVGDTVRAKFKVSLSKPAKKPVKIIYDTGSDTASPGDYTPASDTITIAKGEDKATVKIVVNGDDQDEADEEFSLSIYAEKNVKISPRRGSASGLIIDSD